MQTQAPLYSVFVTTTYGNQIGTAVSSLVIPANGRIHAQKIANQINATNPEGGSYLCNRAHVVGGDMT